ncbi:hypothetical protein HYH02_012549 [Chlamydomonas schloesseri]|uniref:Uncharacterized protein n=1 Tax=Chlamydomonas schloesseri TaxID=2026947 RepID=A0A835T703_9CHLO|nr:hypothetical protein HYH02_012549 [Chlamydomonas schloesseri]|eukprot:KAG2433620.1 hypothetical protein HYH02_012549 [Chlamydomonas schloesseri]
MYFKSQACNMYWGRSGRTAATVAVQTCSDDKERARARTIWLHAIYSMMAHSDHGWPDIWGCNGGHRQCGDQAGALQAPGQQAGAQGEHGGH